MQIVINVDNELYEYFSKRRTMHDNGYFSHVGKLIKALRDGVSLPKGHGDLIDRDAYKAEINRVFPCKDKDDTNIRKATDMALLGVPTIIEADKEE